MPRLPFSHARAHHAHAHCAHIYLHRLTVCTLTTHMLTTDTHSMHMLTTFTATFTMHMFTVHTLIMHKLTMCMLSILKLTVHIFATYKFTMHTYRAHVTMHMLAMHKLSTCSLCTDLLLTHFHRRETFRSLSPAHIRAHRPIAHIFTVLTINLQKSIVQVHHAHIPPCTDLLCKCPQCIVHPAHSPLYKWVHAAVAVKIITQVAFPRTMTQIHTITNLFSWFLRLTLNTRANSQAHTGLIMWRDNLFSWHATVFLTGAEHWADLQKFIIFLILNAAVLMTLKRQTF